MEYGNRGTKIVIPPLQCFVLHRGLGCSSIMKINMLATRLKLSIQ